jgi:hemerythrin-like domain-containing protein
MSAKPTDILKEEHKVILLVLGAAEAESLRIQAGGRANAEKVGQMVDFLRSFADRCHHAKEEKLLFVKMAERGMPVEDGPIAVMLQEHDQGRARVRAVAAAIPQAGEGDFAAATAVRTNLLAFVQLLRQHISKEDNILYPMADQLLSAADQEALGRAFEKVEAEEMGPGFHEKYHKLAHEVAGR